MADNLSKSGIVVEIAEQDTHAERCVNFRQHVRNENISRVIVIEYAADGIKIFESVLRVRACKNMKIVKCGVGICRVDAP